MKDNIDGANKEQVTNTSVGASSLESSFRLNNGFTSQNANNCDLRKP